MKYEIGDTIEYQPFGGSTRIVTVRYKDRDIKNGRPGFDADDVWGYDYQIVRVIPRNDSVT